VTVISGFFSMVLVGVLLAWFIVFFGRLLVAVVAEAFSGLF
jgi:hypothetical protein